MLASEEITLIPKKTEKPVEIAEKIAKKVARRKVKRKLRSLSIDPDGIVVPPVVANGQVTPLFQVIKGLGC